MKRIFSILACLCLTFYSAFASAKTYNVPNDNRTFYVTGVIDFNVIDIANGIERASAAKSAPIHLVINSPGGVVYAGKQVIQAMDIARQRGSKVVCTVGILAASMAFQMLSHCDERYALRNSLLLFHPARVFVRGEALTADQMKIIANDLKRIDARANKENIEMIGANLKWYKLHNSAETLWTAEDLVSETNSNWLTIVDSIDTPHGVFNLRVRGGAGELRRSINESTLPWIIVIIKDGLL